MKKYKLNILNFHHDTIKRAVRMHELLIHKEWGLWLKEYVSYSLPETIPLSENDISEISLKLKNLESLCESYSFSDKFFKKQKEILNSFSPLSEMSRDQYLMIEKSCEILARCLCGQYRTVLMDYYFDWKGSEGIDIEIKAKLNSKLSVNSSYGIYQEQTSEESKIAWDIYQVMRYERSWEEADHEPHERNKHFTEYMTVNYDTPMKTSKHDLITVEIK